MKKILVIGAGRSASALIRYLLDRASEIGVEVLVADFSLDLAQQKVAGNQAGKALQFDVFNEQMRNEYISQVEIVVSLLPADLHFIVAKDCITHKKHLVTASYVSKEMASLNEDAKSAGVILLNEIGVDPGIDHMSAMEVIRRIKNQGATLTGFWSYCGGLVAPESNNLWGYKFTWAPRNVILAGQATAIFLEDGRIRFRGYHRMFNEITTIQVPDYGAFEAYSNRDSLKYLPLYGIEGVKTLFRGTLRAPGYCKMWNAFVKMGMTDDTIPVAGVDGMKMVDFTFSFIPELMGKTKLESLSSFLGEETNSALMDKLLQLDLLGDRKIALKNATPAQVLQWLLEEKWVLGPDDIDLLVMQHQFEYEKGGKKFRITASMAEKGTDQVMTAMAKTVGWPMAIATCLILEGKIKERGVVIPISEEICKPVMAGLEALGIHFKEEMQEL